MDSQENRTLRLAQFSNATDASGREFLEATLTIVAISVLGFSTTQIGILDFLESSAFMFLALPIGLLVDTYTPARILGVSLLMKIALSGALVLGLALGVTHPMFFMAIVFLLGVTAVGSENAQTSLIPFLTRDTSRIEDAVSRMAMADSIAGVVAPAAAGLTLAFTSAPTAAGAALVCFILAAWSALRIAQRLRTSTVEKEEASQETADSPETEQAAAEKDTRSFLTKLTEGFRIIGANRFLLGATTLIAAGNIGLALSDSMVSVVILRTLDLGMPFFGALGTMAALASIVAAPLAPKVVRAVPIRTVFLTSSILQAIIALFPLLALLLPQAAYVLFAVKSIAWAFTLTIANIAGFSYVAKTVDKARLGRASAALRMITMGTVPFAALFGGILADLTSVYVPLIVWPALTAVAVLVYAVLTQPEKS